MKSPLAFFILFSFILIARNVDARKDPAEYWQGVMKNQQMNNIKDSEVLLPLNTKKTGCHVSEKAKKEKSFLEDFEPRPNVSIYHDDTKLSEEKSFVKDFEPRPNISVYHDDVGLKEKKPFVQDFEPRPNVSVYDD